LILVPACNEAGRVGSVLDGVRATGIAADVLVVDDGSSDATGDEARARGAAVARHRFNLGYGAALHTGYMYARRHGYQRLVQLDADGQHDPSSIPELLDALRGGYDVVIGSRYLGGAPPPTSWMRRIGSRFFAWIVTAWTGIPITDPTSGFQAMTARALAELSHAGFPEDYPDADVLVFLARAGCKLHEIPVKMHPRRGGISMHRGRRIAYYAYKMVLSLSLLPVRRRSPFRAERQQATAKTS
jgi:glycosyltransferase involved in cell wall biosynthesis